MQVKLTIQTMIGYQRYNNLFWKIDSGCLTIAGSGEISSNSPPWEDEKYSIKSIVIQNDITSINSSAFEGYTNLTSVTIPNSVKRICYSAFADCSNLTSVSIPSSVKEIWAWAFSGCTKLEKLYIQSIGSWLQT